MRGYQPPEDLILEKYIFMKPRIDNHEKLKQIWLQTKIPAIYRQGKGYPLWIRLPYAESNRIWLRGDKKSKPVWDKQNKHWEVPKAWLNDLVDRSLIKWGRLYIIQPYREQEKCAPSCWGAMGHECQCSCMGENHGSQNSGRGWFIVSDTFATRWGEAELACRLLQVK
jgi:hypothetical protein